MIARVEILFVIMVENKHNIMDLGLFGWRGGGDWVSQSLFHGTDGTGTYAVIPYWAKQLTNRWEHWRCTDDSRRLGFRKKPSVNEVRWVAMCACAIGREWSIAHAPTVIGGLRVCSVLNRGPSDSSGIHSLWLTAAETWLESEFFCSACSFYQLFVITNSNIIYLLSCFCRFDLNCCKWCHLLRSWSEKKKIVTAVKLLWWTKGIDVVDTRIWKSGEVSQHLRRIRSRKLFTE